MTHGFHRQQLQARDIGGQAPANQGTMISPNAAIATILLLLLLFAVFFAFAQKYVYTIQLKNQKSKSSSYSSSSSSESTSTRPSQPCLCSNPNNNHNNPSCPHHHHLHHQHQHHHQPTSSDSSYDGYTISDGGGEDGAVGGFSDAHVQNMHYEIPQEVRYEDVNVSVHDILSTTEHERAGLDVPIFPAPSTGESGSQGGSIVP